MASATRGTQQDNPTFSFTSDSNAIRENSSDADASQDAPALQASSQLSAQGEISEAILSINYVINGPAGIITGNCDLPSDSKVKVLLATVHSLHPNLLGAFVPGELRAYRLDIPEDTLESMQPHVVSFPLLTNISAT